MVNMVYTGKSRVYKVFALGIMIINVCLFYEQQLYGMVGSTRWTHPLCVYIKSSSSSQFKPTQPEHCSRHDFCYGRNALALQQRSDFDISFISWIVFFFVPVVGLWWKHNAHLTKLFKCLLCSCWTNQIRKSGECLMVQLFYTHYFSFTLEIKFTIHLIRTVHSWCQLNIKHFRPMFCAHQIRPRQK